MIIIIIIRISIGPPTVSAQALIINYITALGRITWLISGASPTRGMAFKSDSIQMYQVRSTIVKVEMTTLKRHKHILQQLNASTHRCRIRNLDLTTNKVFPGTLTSICDFKTMSNCPFLYSSMFLSKSCATWRLVLKKQEEGGTINWKQEAEAGVTRSNAIG